jgi:hypothetical protein
MAQTMLKPRNKPRSCDGCSNTYRWRNLIETWTVQNHGHRTGWVKTRLRLCVKCSPATAARRIMMAASVIRR